MADTATPNTRPRGLGYLPGVDGLRGVAVSAVFLFHAGVLDGGFLGVDVFFVISGFLITGLAIEEIESTGRLALGKFWGRRARRLLPAMFALVAAVVLYVLLVDDGGQQLGRDVISTLAYVANWARLVDGYEYFAAHSEPSLLEHTWSLAVEEQFYIVWPLLIVGTVAIARRTGWSPRRAVAGVAAVAAVLSVGWSWVLVDQSAAQLNRLYFGTDTRAVALAVGGVAGCWLARGRNTGSRVITGLHTAAGVVGALVLVVMMAVVDGSQVWLYRFGFGAAALASLAIIVATLGPGPIARMLGVNPLAQLGRVSYGVYLWHWPVIVVLDSETTGLSGPALGAVWVAVTAVLVMISWMLIEKRAPLPVMAVPARAISYAAVCLAIGAAAVVIPLLIANDAPTIAAPSLLSEREEQADDTEAPTTAPLDQTEPAAEPADVPPAAPASTEPDVQPATETPETTDSVEVPVTDPPEATEVANALEVPEGRPVRLLILGDSIAESLGPSLAPVLNVNGVEVEATNRAIIACPVTWIGQWAFDDGRLIGDPPACDGEDRFADTVAEADPDLILMMFGWPGTISGRELPDGTIINPCEPAFDQQFEDEFITLVDRFSEDSTVVVATVAPPTKYRNPAQSDRPDCLNDVIVGQDFNVFDFGEWLCPAADCTAAEPLLRDTIHFSGAAEVREQVWPAIVQQVLEAAGVAV